MLRPEYPRPQFQRDAFLNLNGTWRFAFDFTKCGKGKHWESGKEAFPEKIEVPFCPESSLSGIGYKNFIDSCWYRRKVTVTEADLSGIVRLHFGAVDYKATLFVNGKKIGTHTGGYVSFYFDIQDALTVGENRIALHVEDDTRSPLIPSGKQSTATSPTAASTRARRASGRRYGSRECRRYVSRVRNTTPILKTERSPFRPRLSERAR
jgi:beta-galactosidase/beta-glucuronidase